MSHHSRINNVHWFHLALLAGLPVWWWLATHFALAPTISLFAWIVFNVLMLGVAERFFPYRVDWHPNRKHLKRDGTVWSLNIATDAVATALLTAAAIAWFPGDSHWPIALQILLGILVSELGSYGMHRLSHSEGWLWRVHLLHHRPDRLNVANALTAHPINALYDKLIRVFPLMMLGLNAEAMLAIALFTLTQSLVTHANVAGRIGILNYLVGSAELHRLHHSTAEHQAGNFGTAVPFWDQVFGTFRRGEDPVEVGVFDPKRYPDDLQLWALLGWPIPQKIVGFFRSTFRCCVAGN